MYLREVREIINVLSPPQKKSLMSGNEMYGWLASILCVPHISDFWQHQWKS